MMTHEATHTDALADSIFQSVKDYCAKEVQRHIAEIPAAPPGQDGRDGRDGQDGAPGRDAFALDVLEEIDPSRRYPRGTVACHGGGVVRAFRTTLPLADVPELETAGWHVIVRGVRAVEFEQPDLRTAVVKIVYTDGGQSALALNWPTPIYRGIWQRDTEYQPGDQCTRAGGIWHCTAPTSEPPQAGAKSWVLSAKGGKP